MKNILFIFSLLLSINTYSQSLRGKITGLQGEPVEYATIYVSETKTGCITSESGEFILSLEPGKYTFIVQHMNYQTVTKIVEIPNLTFWEIIMETKNIHLKEVSVSAKDEDKAYRIIRNTVAKSPYYRKQLLSYKTTFYAKGTLKIKNAPKAMNLVNKFLKEENQIPIKKNDIFTEESVSEVTFSSNKIEQKVISKRSSYPEQFSVNVERFNFLNIYRSYDSFISPVTKDGLTAYRYSLDYSYQEGELLIYRIKVTPRNSTPLVYSGYIDIIDDSWHVYDFELKGSMDFGFGKANFTYKQNYVPIEKNVWMPGSFKTKIDAKAMGFHIELNTTYSIRYKDYKVNPELSSPHPPAEISIPYPAKKPVVSKKMEKLAYEISEIMNKEKLTTRETIKLVDLIEAKNNEELKNNSKNDSVNSLEIQRRFFLTVDSNALKYDSGFLENNRTIPLTEEELGGFEEKRKNDSIKEEKKKFSLKDGIEIGKKKKKDKTFFIGVSSTKSVLAFNTVEGFKAGIYLYADKKFKDSVTTLNNGVTLGYAFAAKQVFFELFSQWNYNPKRFASLELFGGKHTCDFKNEQDGKYLMNSISSLFFRENLIQYYDRIYMGFKHKTEVFHSFQMSYGFSYEQQRPLDNRSNYSFFFQKKRDYKSNIPDNKYVVDNSDYLSSQNTLLWDISLSYTPRMFYRYSQNQKIKYYAGSKYPTFTISWKKGLNIYQRLASNFDYLELNITQNINLKSLKHFKYSVTAGFFPNTKNIHFNQFKHFQTNNFWVTFNTFCEAFNTMPNYKYSTNEWFVSGYIKYETLYLLLKFIPGLNKTFITENIHLSFLSNPLTKSYLEIGYSLSKIFFVGNIGFFVGFDEFKSFNWSVRVGFSLF